MKEIIFHDKGLTQSDYQQNKAQLMNFHPIESDWKEIFRWIMSVGMTIEFYDKNGNAKGKISDLWHNHILSVLIDIVQKDVEYAIFAFKHAEDRDKEEALKKDLTNEITSWITRIDNYINKLVVLGQNTESNQALQVAHSIEKELKQTISNETNTYLSDSNGIDFKFFYNLLKTIQKIQQKSSLYIQMIEQNQNMDAALSMLLIFIRNYSSTIERFNHRLSVLPHFYHNQLLQITTQKAVQDRVNLIITPSDPIEGFLLPAHTCFLGGKKEDDTDLIYQTEKNEYISGMRIQKAFTVFRIAKADKKALYKKDLLVPNSNTITHLFTEGKDAKNYVYGWMVESSVLLLKEGKRKIEINFEFARLKFDNPVKKNVTKSFRIYVSDTNGWSLTKHNALVNDLILTITFDLEKEDRSLIAPMKELHQLNTQYPVVRILASNEDSPFDWGRNFNIKKVHIDVDVEHIQGFYQYNEMGEIDTYQPFYPFGPQAEQGTWFRFGNEEMTQKKLTLVSVRGVWDRLPQTKNEYADIYKEYINERWPDKVDNKSFEIECQCLINNEWKLCSPNNAKLFKLADDNERLSKEIFININVSGGKERSKTFSHDISEFTPSHDKYCTFRVILKKPKFGFGSEAYWSIFAERMVYNSQHPATPKNMPSKPLIPLMSDVELAYKASAEIELSTTAQPLNAPIRLSRVTALSEYKFEPVRKIQQAFISEVDDGNLIYLGISEALHKKNIRMYFDLVFTSREIKLDDNDGNTSDDLKWEYKRNGEWICIDSTNKIIDKTYGFTQHGFIEIELPNQIDEEALDNCSLFWLRAQVSTNVNECLPLRFIYMDCITAVAVNGDGTSLPAKTIKELQEDSLKVKSVLQPLVGYGGKIAEQPLHSSTRQNYRISHRNRAVTFRDYEQIILESFPNIQKVCCVQKEQTKSQVKLVVFSYTDSNTYPITPKWELTNIKNYLSSLSSPIVEVVVLNPFYKEINVELVIEIKEDDTEGGEMRQRIRDILYHYFVAWVYEKTLPDIDVKYSGKQLYNLLAHDKNVVKIATLLVDGHNLTKINESSDDIYICGEHPWYVLVPKIIKLVFLYKGIGHMQIGFNFKIGL